jgi:hypothetical protein
VNGAASLADNGAMRGINVIHPTRYRTEDRYKVLISPTVRLTATYAAAWLRMNHCASFFVTG